MATERDSLSRIKVADVMTRRLVIADLNASVHDLACKMRKNRVSSVVILDSDRIAGIVTEHDLAEKVLAASLDPAKTRAGDVMSAPVETISTEADIDEAARIMRDRRIKKLVAIKDDSVAGIITSFDIVVAEPIIRLLAEKRQ